MDPREEATLREKGSLFGRGPGALSVALIFFFAIFGAAPGWAKEPWWKTGKVDGYPSTQYMTALGYGSTLDGARKDATRNLSSQIDADVRSKYRQESFRSGMTARRSVSNALSVETHAKLYGLRNIRGEWVKSQASYIAVVGVKISDLLRYLRGRVDNYRETIASLRADLEGTGDPIRQIRDLSGIVRAKEKAAFFDREIAVVAGGTPSSWFNTEKEITRIENLLSRHLTVTVNLQNGCGKVDRFVSHVKATIEQQVTEMGLLVVPAGGQVVISGHVSAQPMEPGFSREYIYYVLRYDLKMSAPDGTIWGTVAHQRKVAGITPSQAEMLAVRRVGSEGVRPLLQGLRSRLFLSPDNQNYMAFPRDQGTQAAKTEAVVGTECNDFGP
jgi:hypothetical protein